MTHDDFLKIWQDQAEFNRHFRVSPAPTYAQRTADTKEIVLHLVSECDELLRASGAWKPHRRQTVHENPRHVQYELIDIFKYWMTLCQIHGFTPEQMQAAYWEKTMVVRQRYSQEYVQTFDCPLVLVDIDGVLADYVLGFTTWALQKGVINQARYDCIYKFGYLKPSDLNLTTEHYDALRREFRVSGEHAALPVATDAKSFLAWVRCQDFKIVLLTARPIDRFPNLYGETMHWLGRHGLPHDAIWWASDKGALVVEENLRQHVVFAVDDEQRYVGQLAEQGIKTFWLGGNTDAFPYVMSVQSLTDIPRCYEHWLEDTHGKQ